MTFSYRNGALCAENVSLSAIADEIGTPFYAYSEQRLRDNFCEFRDALADLNPLICYAIKANANTHVARVLIEEGAGVDITSGGEMERALKAGASPQKIIFSGVAKSRAEIATALKAGIHQINAESIPEMRTIGEVAHEMGIKAPLALRVNPDVEANTHAKISTGKMGSKFGIDSVQLDEAMELARTLPGIDLKGFQVHIGSHLSDYEDFREAFGRLADMVKHWRGKGFTIERLDLGGGVGIPYDGETQAPFSKYAKIVHETIGHLGCALAFEPGRRLVGDAGTLITRVMYDKQGAARRYLIVDAGMNDLARPAMYDARHSILPVREGSEKAKPADVVGPVCESSDFFGRDYHLPGVSQGDLVAIMQGGAYGSAMSSNYNGRALVPEVLVSSDKFRIIRRRITVAEQLTWES